MSQFKFKVEKIFKLEKSKTIVVDGFLLDGNILTSSSAILEHDENKNPIVISGIVLGEYKIKASNILSLTIDSLKSKNALNLMKEGDFLVGS